MSESKRPGLYANINAKRKRIENGSGEKMREPGSPGAPKERAFRESAATQKPKRRSRASTNETSSEQTGSRAPSERTVVEEKTSGATN